MQGNLNPFDQISTSMLNVQPEEYNHSIIQPTVAANVHTWLHAALALISKQAHLLTAVHAVNTVQFKVNCTDPYMAMVYLHICLLQL
jgi:ribonuclease HIII